MTRQTGKHLTVELYLQQAQFRHSTATFRGFVGGRGCGKSFIGAYDLLRRAKPGRLYGVYAPTYIMLRDASLRSFMELGNKFGFITKFNESRMLATLGNGAEVIFRSVDDPERARGPNMSGAWLDEASLQHRAAWEIIIACLREAGEMGWLSATFTPKGRSHWTYDVFGHGGDNIALFHATSYDNPFLPPVFVETIRKEYTSQFARQELGGEFIEMEGNLAKREWFPIVDDVPLLARKTAHWDFAATEKQTSSDDPDYVCRVLMVEHNGIFYIEHVIRQRLGPGAVERLVTHTANEDGRGTAITLEQEPGAAGKLFTRSIIRALAGWNVRAVPASGDKVARAMAWLAQAEMGNVRLKRGAWNAEYLDEICAFPLGGHDDQVDATSGAFAQLAGRRPATIRRYGKYAN